MLAEEADVMPYYHRILSSNCCGDEWNGLRRRHRPRLNHSAEPDLPDIIALNLQRVVRQPNL